ncbi:hypothetical protein K2X89_02800 [Myxococcota bacterium]|nr:hypothetical protein [Myxococcota bacterium]
MTERHHAWLLWLGLAIASSPALAGLAQSLRDEPSQRYTLLALLLLGLLLVRGAGADETIGRRPRGGMALVLLGWAAQLLGAAAASAFISHVGLAISIFGLGLFVGWPAPTTSVLVFGLIPVPGFVHAMGSPVVEATLGKAAGLALGWIGLPVEAGGPLLQSGGGRFEIVASDAGLVTAICAAEVAWYGSRRRGEVLAEGLLRTGRAAATGLVVQPLLVVLAAASLPLGQPELGRFLLSHGVPIALAFTVLALEAVRRP